jgi:glycosyltransferase involved in cell wall biosynthesis
VLHVIPSVADCDGGPSVAVKGMARAVAASGADVEIATTDADGTGRLAVETGRPVRDGEVTTWYFPRSVPGSWKFSWGLTQWLRDHVGRFDVVHVHALFSFATIPGCRLAARRGVPYVLRPLGTLAPLALARRAWKKRPYFALVERDHLARAAALHATSETEARSLASLGFGDRTWIIPLGVSASVARPRIARDGVRVLFLGRLHPVKEIPLLLEAFAALAPAVRDRAELVVAGDGEPAYLARLAAAVQALGIGGRTRFVGHLEGEAKASALADADIFVLPSRHENFGVAAAEAAAAGLPLILSEDVGLAPAVSEAGAGVIVPRQREALAAAIGGLVMDAAARRRMGACAAALAAERFSWDRAGRELLAMYDAVTRERAKEAG